jgi:DNA invertase Pin-like site-specific DNA recombinase
MSMNEPKLRHPLLTLKHLALAVLIYIRQSTLSQVHRHSGSTDIQRQLVDLAKDYGFPEDAIRVIDEDQGKSGKSTLGRTGWDEMLRLIASGSVGAVFFYDVKRLAREVGDFNELLVLCRYHNVIMVLDGRPTDPNNPNDAALLQIQAAFAEFDNRSRADLLRRSRFAKAEKGQMVSSLPVGWIQNEDGTFAYDPEVRPAIDDVIRTFQGVRTLRGTVSRLNAQGKLLPTRYRGRQLKWKKATIDMVRRILLLPAYAGFYVYGLTEHRPEFGLYKSGMPRRKRVPRDRWVVIPNHHPAYMTAEEQDRIRELLRNNGFTKRSRPGNGEALCQGLVRCATCGGMLTVAYPKPNHGPHRYQCNVLSTKFGENPCCSIQGTELDAAVERSVLAVLRTPPLDVLREALAEAREADRTHVARLDADRQRLTYRVELARDRFEKADPRNTRVFAFASEQFEKCMQEQSDFNQRLALEPPRPSADATEEELRDLCAVASDIPRVWSHSAVSHRERKEVLRCLIETVKVSTTPLSIEITVLWASGAETTLRLWRRAGVDELIRQRHAEGMTAREIRNWLAGGDATTGQRWERTTAAVYQALRRLGVQPHPARQTMAAHRPRVRELYDAGKTLREIAALLNASGSRTPNGGPWKVNSVHRALGLKLGRDRYARLHRELFADAKRRGLTAEQTADEFNAKRIPRYSTQPWTADAVRQRGAVLKRTAQRSDGKSTQVRS